MNARWKAALMKIALWIISEIILNSTGLDGLADFSEYVFDSRFSSAVHAQEAIASHFSGLDM
jgi:hypothetical protein